MYKINKKDITRFNQEIGETGEFSNESSLDFSIGIITRGHKSWLYELSYLVRSLLVDHVFMDGNKRTALLVVIAYFEYNGSEFKRENLIILIKRIAKNNIININKIMRLINNVTR